MIRRRIEVGLTTKTLLMMTALKQCLILGYAMEMTKTMEMKMLMVTISNVLLLCLEDRV